MVLPYDVELIMAKRFLRRLENAGVNPATACVLARRQIATFRDRNYAGRSLAAMQALSLVLADELIAIEQREAA